MSFLLALNWKMNKTPKESGDFLKNLLKLDLVKDAEIEICVFPQNFSITVCAELLKNTKITWGAQNCYFESEGAFTGENSPKILKEMGAKYVLVGHSERRFIFNEDNSIITKKVNACVSLGLIPILCVGEKQGEDFKNCFK